MSAFSEREPFKKRVITVSVTAEQRAELDLLKANLGVTTDGGIIKAALAHYSDSVLGGKEGPAPVVRVFLGEEETK